MIINSINKPVNNISDIISDFCIDLDVEQFYSDVFDKNDKKYIDIILSEKNNIKYFCQLKNEIIINIIDNYAIWKNKKNIIIDAKELNKLIDLNIHFDNDIDEDIMSICIENPNIIDNITIDNSIKMKITGLLFKKNNVIPIFKILI